MVWSVILRKIIFVGREAVDAFSNRHPMFVAALVAATCVLVADQHLVVSVVLAGLFGLLGWLISSWRVGIA